MNDNVLDEVKWFKEIYEMRLNDLKINKMVLGRERENEKAFEGSYLNHVYCMIRIMCKNFEKNKP